MKVEATLAEAIGHHRQGRLEHAALLYERVLAAAPKQPDALHLLGLVAHQRGDQRRARALIDKALARQPGNAVFLNSLGSVLLAEGEAERARAVLVRAVRAKPGYAEALNNLGNAFARLGRGDDALKAYDDALALRPGDAQTLNNRAAVLKTLGRLQEAEADFVAATARDPRYATAHANRGLVLHDLGRYDEAEACYQQALLLEPQHAQAHANRAVLLLLRGHFEEGWREYAWRWRAEGFTTPRRAFVEPEWDGRALDGRTILLHAEQGIGSAIQFVRYVFEVAAAGGRIVLECQRPLERLFRWSLAGDDGPVAAIVAKGEMLPAFDVHLPLMSLPERCATTLATIPSHIPYLKAAAADIASWERRLKGAARPRVGLVWAGNPNHSNDRNRSAAAAVLAPLVAAGGSWFSLQVGASAGVGEFPAGTVIDLAPNLHDFAETAAVLSVLDLVISVDTAVAHLGGAMGRPVWLLLPFVPEWRWLLDRADSPWYPSMRLFRQRAPGDWAEVIGRVRAALAEFTVAG